MNYTYQTTTVNADGDFFQRYLNYLANQAKWEIRHAMWKEMNMMLWGTPDGTVIEPVTEPQGLAGIVAPLDNSILVPNPEHKYPMNMPWEWEVSPQVGEVSQPTGDSMTVRPSGAYQGFDTMVNDLMEEGWNQHPQTVIDLQDRGLLPGHTSAVQAGRMATAETARPDMAMTRISRKVVHEMQDVFYGHLQNIGQQLTFSEDERAKMSAHMEALQAESRLAREALAWLKETFDFYEKDSDDISSVALAVIAYATKPREYQS